MPNRPVTGNSAISRVLWVAILTVLIPHLGSSISLHCIRITCSHLTQISFIPTYRPWWLIKLMPKCQWWQCGSLMCSMYPVYVEVRVKVLRTRMFVPYFWNQLVHKTISELWVCGSIIFVDPHVSFVADFQRSVTSLQTMKKRFFILRGDSSEASARLEYYEDEKKWRKNHCPRRYSELPYKIVVVYKGWDSGIVTYCGM